MGDTAARVGAAEAVVTALDRFFDTFYRQRPVSATFTGLHAHDDRLPDWSPTGLDAEADAQEAVRRELDLAGRVPDDAVTAFPLEVDLALADAVLEIARAEHASGHFVHRNPTLWTGEAIFGVLSLVTRDFGPLATRLDHARARLDAVPGFLAAAANVLREAPADWRERAVREARAGMSLFEEALPAWVDAQADSIGYGAAAAWRASATHAAEALGRFVALVAALPEAPRSDAGGELLALLLRRGHWVTTPIPDLLAEATDALDEAAARLEAMSRPHGGWAAVQDLLAAEHPTAEGYLARFDEKWRACWQKAHDYKLVTWPMAPLRYVPIPAHTREAAEHLYYLHYRSPAPFDPFGTFDYVVPPIDGLDDEALEARLRAVNDSVVTLNHVVHHGAIGHHVQNHHAYKGRSRVGKVAAVDTANRIAMFTGGSLAEGWACYVCDLMEEIGFLTPLEQIAQQHTRVRIAARAVVDLSLHTGRRTLAEAAALYQDRAHMSGVAARAEAVRNSMYPGTAAMYWLGTRGLHQLRVNLWARQGGAFSMRAFHDRVLKHGAIPVALIARLMLAEEST
ncbi:MAG: DUF885 family protein [Acidobacteria bacterium]|nr:DUF885 family protein [Acidobacteriota bacterium]